MTTTATDAADDKRLILVDGPRLGHIPSFDGVRGIFILQVVLYHAGITNRFGGSMLLIDWFFVASGFLITSLLLDERRRSGVNSLRAFYRRRILRLFPAMYAMLGVYTVVLLGITIFAKETAEEIGPWWVDIISASLYSFYLVAAIAPDQISGVVGHVWSLTVEEQFYFFWPVLAIYALNKARRRNDFYLIVGAAAFIIMCFSFRWTFQHLATFKEFGEVEFADQNNPTWQGFLYRFASFRPDMIIYGCLLAFLNRWIPRPFTPALRKWLGILATIAWIFLVSVVLFAGTVPGFFLYGGPIYSIALLLLGPMILHMYYFPDNWFVKILCWQPFKWLGLRAYGIYMWHLLAIFPFTSAIEDATGINKLIPGLIASALGIGLGLLSYRYIEMPFLRRKDAMKAKEAASLAQQQPASDS